MNFFIFASTLALAAAIAIATSQSKKSAASTEQDYWQRERAANSTRRKSLDDLPYIKSPMELFPMELLSDVSKVEDYRQIVLSLKDLPIVNFTGLSNTELKPRYGAPNIDLLTSYDQNYTLLVRTIQQWAQALYDNGYPGKACQLLEFAVSTGTDVSATYRLLCRIYQEQGTPEKYGISIPSRNLCIPPCRKLSSVFCKNPVNLPTSLTAGQTLDLIVYYQFMLVQQFI